MRLSALELVQTLAGSRRALRLLLTTDGDRLLTDLVPSDRGPTSPGGPERPDTAFARLVDVAKEPDDVYGCGAAAMWARQASAKVSSSLW